MIEHFRKEWFARRPMKHFVLSLILAVVALPQLSHGQPEASPKAAKKLQLVEGDSITGTVSGVKDGSVSVITDYGVIRVPVLQLTEASRKELGISSTASVEQLQKRVTELEALVERLRAENSDLRKQQASTPSAPASPGTRVQSLVGGSGGTVQPKATPAPATSGAAFWISTTGKRHNARCRYYGTSKGRSGSATEGVACKVCGG